MNPTKNIFNPSNNFYINTYILNFFSRFQYQKYVCEATNRLGKSNATVELFETVIPICPPACDEVNYSSEAAIARLGPGLLLAAALCYLLKL